MSSYAQFLRRLDGLRSLGVDLGLDRVRKALAALGSPESRVPAIHIAGTNGKGSTAAMADAILRAAGLRVGLFTSPHLSRFTERIRVDGIEADGDCLGALDDTIRATGVPLTYFEVSAVLAFLWMADARVDVAVLETGLGGRLDATTVCSPLATGITGIAVEHTEFLGSSLREIAREKAGIAKRGVTLFLCEGLGEGLAGAGAPSADDGREAADEIRAAAAVAGAPIAVAGRELVPAGTALALAGEHQIANAALAVALAGEACRALGRALSGAAIRRGLESARWPGRLELVAPGTLLDCAHNVESAGALARALRPMPRPRALVVSVVRGKDAAAMLRALAPEVDILIATESGSRRAIAASDLASLSPGAVSVPDPREAVAEARRRVGNGGLVVVAGSIFLVGEVRADLLGEQTDPVGVSDPLP